MPKPWEMTPEEARLVAQRSRKRTMEADRIAAPLLARQLEERELEELTARIFEQVEGPPLADEEIERRIVEWLSKPEGE